jgi:hypothetical protein
MIGRVKRLDVITVGAVCAVLTTVVFVVGIVLMVASGVQVLIPGTGQDAIDWIVDVDDASGAFFAGAWLVIVGGILGLVAIVGFYYALRDAGEVMILAPILAVVGLTLVTISHLIPIAMAYELVPEFVDADASRATLQTTADTLAATALVLNYVGDILLWGIVIPMFAYAILETRAVARWIGWLGFVVAVFAGWLYVLSPASSVIEGISFIGYVAFFLFMLVMGVALLRDRQAAG